MRKKISDLTFKLTIALIGIALFTGAILYANEGFGTNQKADDIQFETGRIINILSIDATETNGVYQGQMTVIVQIETGIFTGQTREVTYFLNQMTTAPLTMDTLVSVRLSTEDNLLTNIHIQHPERRQVVIAFFALFFVVLALLGGKKGIMSILGLAFTLVSLYLLLIPLMLRGYPVILTTFFILTVVIVVVLSLLAGMSAKGISAIIGCLIGLIITATFGTIGARLAHITGFHMEEIGLILTTTNMEKSSASGLLISGLLIASLGAIMDTALTVSSTIHEMRQANAKLSARALFKSGMNVGKDTMGTMSTTLILAFAGTSLNMMILLYGTGTSFNQLINSHIMVIEIMRAIGGSLGIILTIPAVAFISSILE